jgi:hypothetical protein
MSLHATWIELNQNFNMETMSNFSIFLHQFASHLSSIKFEFNSIEYEFYQIWVEFNQIEIQSSLNLVLTGLNFSQCFLIEFNSIWTEF